MPWSGFPAVLYRLLFASVCVAGVLTPSALAESEGRRIFTISASTAEKSLKLFAGQSGVEVVYPAEVVRGVRTPEVKGRMTPAEAVERLLSGTGLASAQDKKTGAFSISRRNASPKARDGDGTSNGRSSQFEASSAESSRAQATLDSEPKKKAPEPLSVRDSANFPTTTNMKSKKPTSFLLAWLALLGGPAHAVGAAGSAAPQSSGTIVGRVLSASTGEYLRNAEVSVRGTDLIGVTTIDGRYRIAGVPAGPVDLTVHYTGYRQASATVSVSAGTTMTRDFELQSTQQGRESSLVQLDRFTVSAEREGTAKAIMEQRTAMNIKNVVASDTFSIMTEGNIGEVLQYLPGIHIRYSDGEPAEPMMRGMHEKYGALLVDGVRMTSGGSRAPALGSYSAYATDTIEFNKTNSADMDADAPAGSVNMKSKSAFQRKDRYFGWQAYTIVNSVVNSLGKTPGPRDGESFKTLPSVVLDYSDVYLDGKLGVLVNLSENNSYPVSSFLNPSYNSVPTAASPAPLVITQLAFGATPKFIKRRGGGLNLEYKLSPRTSIALRGQLGWEDFETLQRTFTLVSGRPNQAATANVNAMVANPTSNNATRFMIGGAHRDNHRLSYTIAPQFTYETGALTVDASIAYTELDQFTRNGRVDGNRVPLTQANYQLFGVGFTATRENPGDARFDFHQTSGPSLYRLENYTATSLTNNLIRGQNDPTTSTLVGQVNAKFTTAWRYPTFFKAGLKSSFGEFLSETRNYSWTYIGPRGDRLTAHPPVTIAFRNIAPLDAGNLFTDQAIEFPDREALGRLLKSNPEYFIPNPTNATSDTNLFPKRNSREYIDAAYAMGNGNFGRLTVQGGVRYEATKTQGKVYERGELKTRSGSYDDFFLSGSARYRFQNNLMMIVGASQSIQRAPLSSMAAVATINENTMTGTIPNLNLKPERGDNYSFRLEKYFEPVGVVSAGVFMFRMEDYHAQTTGVPADVLGLEAEYPNFLFNSLANVDSFTTKGLELEVSHQMSYLPGLFRGLAMFANYTQVQRSDPELAYRAAPRFASGGISFRHKQLSVSFSGTWTSEYLQNATLYNRERTLISTNLSFQFTPRLAFFVTGRNLFRDPQVGYLRSSPGVLGQIQMQAAVWSIGLRGNL